MVATTRDQMTRADAALAVAMAVVAVVITAAGAVCLPGTLAPPAGMLTGTMTPSGRNMTRRNPLRPEGDAGDAEDAAARWAPAWDVALMNTNIVFLTQLSCTRSNAIYFRPKAGSQTR